MPLKKKSYAGLILLPSFRQGSSQLAKSLCNGWRYWWRDRLRSFQIADVKKGCRGFRRDHADWVEWGPGLTATTKSRRKKNVKKIACSCSHFLKSCFHISCVGTAPPSSVYKIFWCTFLITLYKFWRRKSDIISWCVTPGNPLYIFWFHQACAWLHNSLDYIIHKSS